MRTAKKADLPFCVHICRNCQKSDNGHRSTVFEQQADPIRVTGGYVCGKNFGGFRFSEKSEAAQESCS